MHAFFIDFSSVLSRFYCRYIPVDADLTSLDLVEEKNILIVREKTRTDGGSSSKQRKASVRRNVVQPLKLDSNKATEQKDLLANQESQSETQL